MEDYAWVVQGEEVLHRRAVACVAEDQGSGNSARGGFRIVCQSALEFVKIAFCGLEQEQCGEREAGQAQGKGGADGAAGAGDERGHVEFGVEGLRR